MKDSYTISLVFGNKSRYLAFGGNSSILPIGFKITTNRNVGAKFSRKDAEKVKKIIKAKNLGEQQIRIESTDFDSSL